MAQVLYFVAAGATLYGGRQAAKAQAKQGAYEQQRARQEYLQYKQEGIAVLNEMLENSAMVNAYAGAGGIDAGTGSPDDIATFNLFQGVNDLITANQGGQFALRSGTLRQEQMMLGAKATQINAFAQATGYVAAGIDAGKKTG